ncbi:hypothetical protein [Eisenbergiella sp.]
MRILTKVYKVFIFMREAIWEQMALTGFGIEKKAGLSIIEIGKAFRHKSGDNYRSGLFIKETIEKQDKRRSKKWKQKTG